MARSKCLFPTKRAQIIALSRCGQSQRCIARLFGISKTAVQQVIRKFKLCGSFKNALKAGRPHKTTPRLDRLLSRMVKVNPRVTTKAICETMNSDKYIQLMTEKLKVFMNIHKSEIFMQDSAPCHVSKKSLAWFRQQGIKTLDMPGNSPFKSH